MRKQCYACELSFIGIVVKITTNYHAFLSNVFYWQNTKHPMAETLKTSLHIFNDYYVENFHSTIRRQTSSFNTAQQIIHQAKAIDQARGKSSFNENFSNNHNII